MPDQSPWVGQQRVVRVFVSSTFRDMHEEREELVKRIFPQLRKLCEQRGVTWGEVDLRWGITREQAERGEVLPVILEEIQRCRPYFIGLLGERYGWVPEEIPPELIEREGWLDEHRNHSVTELEILHGVLNNPEMANHAFFYFRDPSFVDSVPAEQREVFCEVPTPEDIEKYGLQEAERRAEERKLKLDGLKVQIRASEFSVRENYDDAQVLGQFVLEDLTELINHQYPSGSEPDTLEREAVEHEAFAESRARVYIGRQEYFDQLKAHIEGDSAPLVVLGESGSGKSALLANWALKFRAEHDDAAVIMHFIGATPYSADWAAMLRRIMGELKRRFDIQEEIPDDTNELRSAFANWLHLAAAKGRIVLVLDALNQLEDRDGAPDLVWLPAEIPKGVRVLLSTLPGRALDELNRRGWLTLEVKLLRSAERKKLITEYLAQYTKRLSAERINHIAAERQTSNPLYLRALLEELRVYGDHETLEERINYYLGSRSVAALYQKMLARHEQDYERERPGLVRDAFSLLWAARRGLSESELLEMLGTNGEPLPRACWSPLYLAVEQSLVSRTGLLTFFHDYLRRAVKARYLSRKEQRQKIHLRLADYFANRPSGARQVEELPWQLTQAGSWQRLAELLSDLTFFEASWNANPFDVKTYWAMVEASSRLRLVNAYGSALIEPEGNIQRIEHVAALFFDTGHFLEALSLYKQIADYYYNEGSGPNIRESLGNQAKTLWALGELDKALDLRKQQERACRHSEDKSGLQDSLSGQALILEAHGAYSDAYGVYKEVEQICRETGNRSGLAMALGNQAMILAGNDSNRALALVQEVERIYREIGNKDGLAKAIGLRANILTDQGDGTEVIALLQEEQRIGSELGSQDSKAAALGNRANILYEQGDLEGALKLIKEAEAIYRAIGAKSLLGVILGNEANVIEQQGDTEGALALHKEAEQIWREMGSADALAATLFSAAMILDEQGKRSEALALYEEMEQICREGVEKHPPKRVEGGKVRIQSSFVNGLIQALNSQARLLVNMDRPHEALKQAERAHKVAVNYEAEESIAGTEATLQAVQFALWLTDSDHRVSSPGQKRTSKPSQRAATPTRRRSAFIPTAHQGANAEHAAQENIRRQELLARYKEELARWQSLSWWKRLKVKKPEPPQ